MKRFKFPLEKVLDYRRQIELERRRALALAVRVLTQREGELDAIGAQVDAYRTQLAEMSSGKLSARELALYRSYLTHLELQMTRAAQWARDARAAVEARRAELVAAAKEAKVLEKLKARDRARYDYAANREEAKDLDEIGTTGFLAGRDAVGAEDAI
jgi:flagellar protein FliJ